MVCDLFLNGETSFFWRSANHVFLYNLQFVKLIFVPRDVREYYVELHAARESIRWNIFVMIIGEKTGRHRENCVTETMQESQIQNVAAISIIL